MNDLAGTIYRWSLKPSKIQVTEAEIEKALENFASGNYQELAQAIIKKLGPKALKSAVYLTTEAAISAGAEKASRDVLKAGLSTTFGDRWSSRIISPEQGARERSQNAEQMRLAARGLAPLPTSLGGPVTAALMKAALDGGPQNGLQEMLDVGKKIGLNGTDFGKIRVIWANYRSAVERAEAEQHKEILGGFTGEALGGQHKVKSPGVTTPKHTASHTHAAAPERRNIDSTKESKLQAVEDYINSTATSSRKKELASEESTFKKMLDNAKGNDKQIEQVKEAHRQRVADIIKKWDDQDKRQAQQAAAERLRIEEQNARALQKLGINDDSFIDRTMKGEVSTVKDLFKIYDENKAFANSLGKPETNPFALFGASESINLYEPMSDDEKKGRELLKKWREADEADLVDLQKKGGDAVFEHERQLAEKRKQLIADAIGVASSLIGDAISGRGVSSGGMVRAIGGLAASGVGIANPVAGAAVAGGSNIFASGFDRADADFDVLKREASGILVERDTYKQALRTKHKPVAWLPERGFDSCRLKSYLRASC